MMQPQVTILIPHYKTLPLTKVCLQLLHKQTDLAKAKIVVIENGSQDDSLDYLKTLPWIDVVPRTVEQGESPVQSHARALDLGLSRVSTPYVLSIHTDTLVLHPHWLTFLMNHLEKDSTIAGVGSWKLESKSFWRRALKRIEYAGERILSLRRTKRGGKSSDLATAATADHYLRSHCALYRTDLLKKYHLHFSNGDQVAGKYIHQQLIARGHQMIFLPSEILMKYLIHLNHATTVLNPALSRRTRVDKDLARIRKQLRAVSKADAIEMPF
ncbi:MAG: hypothetical protein ACD_45C00576G0002 [uncultured bacterium]|nr:MAG: hypothetical protein ACD_45C00576G0002 [uncultured bacterium]